jgi:uncharacterized membrane protein YtjA (UPF0391 family)
MVICSFCSLLEAEATTGRNTTFFQSLAFNRDLGATRGIDAALQEHKLDALVLPASLGFTTVPGGAFSLAYIIFDIHLTLFTCSYGGLSHCNR